MDEGVCFDELLRIYCPVGINILAETPPEIAISIVAQLVLNLAQQASDRKKNEINSISSGKTSQKRRDVVKFGLPQYTSGSGFEKNSA
jgi:hypothetical protein